MTPDPSGPKHRPAPRARRAVRVAAFGSLLFVLGTLAAPLLRSAGAFLGDALYLIYSPLCHQLPARSLFLAGEPLAVCARCSGLYLGGTAALFFAGAWALGRLRPRPVWLLVAAVPTVVDALLPWVGLPGLADLPRHLLAWPVGFLAGWFLAEAIADLFRVRTTSSTRPVTRAHSP